MHGEFGAPDMIRVLSVQPSEIAEVPPVLFLWRIIAICKCLYLIEREREREGGKFVEEKKREDGVVLFFILF